MIFNFSQRPRLTIYRSLVSPCHAERATISNLFEIDPISDNQYSHFIYKNLFLNHFLPHFGFFPLSLAIAQSTQGGFLADLTAYFFATSTGGLFRKHDLQLVACIFIV